VCDPIWQMMLHSSEIEPFVRCSDAVKMKDALDEEIEKKTHIASNQRVSGIDAQRINSQLSELKSNVAQTDKELADLDQDLNNEEQLYSQEKMSVSLLNYRLIQQYFVLITL